MSICLQLWDEFTKEIQRAHPKAEDWLCFRFFVVGGGVFFFNYIVSLVNCLIPFYTERAWEMVNHSLLGQTQQWCDLTDASTELLKVFVFL